LDTIQDAKQAAAETSRQEIVNADTKTLQNLNNELDDTVKTLKDVDKAQQGVNKTFAQTENTISGLQTEYKKQLAALKEIDRSTDEGNKAFQEQLQVVGKLKGEINDFNKAVRDQSKAVNDLSNGYTQANKRLGDARKELRDLVKGFDENGQAIFKNAQQADKLNREITILDQSLKDFDRSVGQNFRSIGDYRLALADLGEQAGGLVGAFGKGGGGLSGVVGEFGSLLGGLGPVGLAAGAALGAVGAGVNELIELTGEVNQQLAQVEGVLDTTGDEALEATAQFRALAAAFENVEFEEGLAAGNALIQNFGLNAEQANEILAAGLAANVAGTEDLLAITQEYSNFIAEAGGNAQDLVGIVQAGTQQGVFSDKSIDAVKEFTIRLRESTPATLDALDALGQQRKELILAERDQGNFLEALRLTSEGLTDAGLTAQQTGTIIADVFGGAGEDAGLGFLSSLQDVIGASADLEESLTDTQRAAFNLFEAEQELAQAQVELADQFSLGGTQIQTVFTRIQTFFVDVLGRIIDAFEPVRRAVGRLGDQLSELFNLVFGGSESFNILEGVLDAISFVFNVIFGTVSRVVDVFTLLVESVVDIIEKVPFLDTILGSLRTLFSDLGTAVVSFVGILNGGLQGAFAALQGFNDAVVETFKNAIDVFRNFSIQDLITGNFDGAALVAQLSAPFGALGDNIADAAKEGFNDIVGIFDEVEPDLESEAETTGEETGKAFGRGLNKGFKTEFKPGEIITPDALARPVLAAIEGIKEPALISLDEFNKGIAEKNEQLRQQEFERNAQLVVFGEQAAQEAVQNATDTLINGLGQIFSARTAAAQANLDLVQQSFDAELESAGENEAAREEILKRRVEAEREAAERVGRAQRQQAAFEKSLAIIDIIINTAKGVAAATALGPFVAPFVIPLVIATGAAQIALVASQQPPPVPAFGEGTEDAPGGLSLVGEKGQSELVLHDGKMWITPRKPTLVNLPKHAQVIPIDEDNELAYMGRVMGATADGIMANINERELKEIRRVLGDKLDKVGRSLENQVQQVFAFRNGHFETFVQRVNGRTKYINDRYK